MAEMTLANMTRHAVDSPRNAITEGSALARWIRESLGTSETIGVDVNASTVRGLPAAWYSLNKICGHVGSLPLNLYRRNADDDGEIASDHPAHWLVRREPSALTAASVWRETMQHHALLYGNGRSAIVRNGRGEPSELVLLRPSSWAIVVQPAQQVGEFVVPSRKWHVRHDDPRVAIPDEDCLHIMGLSDDGFSGLGVIDAAKQALGLAIAQQTRAVTTEKNGAKLRFLIKAPPGAFRDEASAKAFVDAFNEYHSGVDNADKVGLLREGMSVEAISQNNRDAQMIESRTFSRQDIGLLFQVEQMLGDDSSVSYNSLEQKNQAYLTNCLMRWLTRWEEECARKLLTSAQYDSDQWYFRFVTAALLRGTTKERYEVYQIGRQIEVLSANDVRRLEEMPKIDSGDTYENPAINPSKEAASATQPATANQEPAPAADTPTTSARLGRVVLARVRHIVDVEKTRVQKAAETEANFCQWLDEFYVGWRDRIAAVVSECEGPVTLAADWVRDSQERLLDVAGKVSSGLGVAVKAELREWDQRINKLAADVVAGR